jgi:hypothetical protein
MLCDHAVMAGEIEVGSVHQGRKMVEFIGSNLEGRYGGGYGVCFAR